LTTACAGADDGKIRKPEICEFKVHTSLAAVGAADRGNFVCADPGANKRGVRPERFALTVTEPVAVTQPYAESDADADRRGFQRRIGHRPRSATLQSDGHQPGARHGAARG
jgi:hypothetical protein